MQPRPPPAAPLSPANGLKLAVNWWRTWWRRQPANKQDRFAVMAPVAAVLLFLAAIIAAFSYLRLEEMEREHEALKRDVEYAQQQIRLRLLERQDQLVRLSRETANGEVDTEEFMARAESLIDQYHELQILSWIDKLGNVKVSFAIPSLNTRQLRVEGSALPVGETQDMFQLAGDMQQPVYSEPNASKAKPPLLELHLPFSKQGRVGGELLAEYSIDSILQLGALADFRTKYAVALLDSHGQVLAGDRKSVV